MLDEFVSTKSTHQPYYREVPLCVFVDLLWWFESHEILHFHDKIVTTNDIENHYKSCCFSSINTWSIRLFHAKSDHIGSSSWQALRHSALPFFFTLAIAEFWDCHFILFFDTVICYKVLKTNFIISNKIFLDKRKFLHGISEKNLKYF